MLTQQEKERRVTELYNQGWTIREISKEVRKNFRDIGTIIRKTTGEKEEKQGSVSPSSNAYHLFSKGKTPIYVAVSLNLTEGEVTKYYEEYWNLNQMHTLRIVYNEIGDDIVPFLKLYRLSKDAHINQGQVINLLKIANKDLPLLELTHGRVKKEVAKLESEKLNLSNDLKGLGDQIRTLRYVLESLEEEEKKITELHKQKNRLEVQLKQFKENNEKYLEKIRQTVQEEVNNTLSKSKDLLNLAAYSVIESIMKDPTKFNFFVNSSQFYDERQQTALQPNFMDVYRILVLDEAQRVFEVMIRDLTNKIMDDAISKITP